jgi:hypothetical protein
MNQTMSRHRNPRWWTEENETAWDRIKMAMKRDWDQTKHDFGGKNADTNQKIGNTSRQAAGQEAIPPRGQPAYEELEPAYRYGYGARLQYGEQYPDWDNDLERRLEEEWRALDPARKEKWEQDRAAIRYGWNYIDEQENLEDDDEND